MISVLFFFNPRDLYYLRYTDWLGAHGTLSPSDPLPVKQSVWDKQGILSSHATVESAISDSCQKARFLAAAAPHSRDWLLALPVTSCGLRLTDEAVRVAVALRLGCSVCVAHACRYGSLVDALGIYGSMCKQAPSKIARHQAIYVNINVNVEFKVTLHEQVRYSGTLQY